MAGAASVCKDPGPMVPGPEVNAYLRITIGTDAEADALLKAVRRIHPRP